MKNLTLILILLFSANIFAAGGGQHFDPAGTNIRSKDSLRNGAKYYMNYCAACHSLQYQRYSRMAEDLGMSKDEVMDNLVFTDAKFTDHITNTMDNDQVKEKEWFYAAYPKDLSLIAKARGVDWLSAYLKSFYKDDKRPSGWNNTVFDKASMPHVMWELQGIQGAEFDSHEDENGIVSYEFKGFTQITEGSMSPEEFDETIRDVVNFLDYSAEPAKLIRMAYAPWVILFMVVFTFLAYLLKINYFRDIH